MKKRGGVSKTALGENRKFTSLLRKNFSIKKIKISNFSEKKNSTHNKRTIGKTQKEKIIIKESHKK